MKYRSLGPFAFLLAICAGPVLAQSSEPLSDAERARRDAEKVFSFIKFHTVRPAAAAPKPAPAPAVAARPAPRPTPAPAPAPIAVAAVAAASVPASAPAPAAMPADAVAVPPPPAASAAPAALPANPGITLPPAAEPVASPASAPAPVEEEPEEVPLKLIAYVAPVMSTQVIDAMGGRVINVPVRFIVQPSGVVSEARSIGRAPRAVANAAVRAVQEWRFEPIPAVREVDVELAFKLED